MIFIMISKQKSKLYCCEDISLVENYEEAVNSPLRYDIHHRIETDGDKLYSQSDLINMNLYYHRPASELIFLSHSDHIKLHYKYKPRSTETKEKISNSLKGNIPWNKGKKGVSDETRLKMSISAKNRKRTK